MPSDPKDTAAMRLALEALERLRRDHLLVLQTLIAERGASDLNPSNNATVRSIAPVIAALNERLLEE